MKVLTCIEEERDDEAIKPMKEIYFNLFNQVYELYCLTAVPENFM